MHCGVKHFLFFFTKNFNKSSLHNACYISKLLSDSQFVRENCGCSMNIVHFLNFFSNSKLKERLAFRKVEKASLLSLRLKTNLIIEINIPLFSSQLFRMHEWATKSPIKWFQFALFDRVCVINTFRTSNWMKFKIWLLSLWRYLFWRQCWTFNVRTP